ncbi:unnamed protein product [Blepharisma stoltei]|uniref:Hypoxanthine phosphoribosyltransferase n=1 Tax=Blepharisma stoltei TaxID=1481888 RepID=A0AAU9JIH3_9CILI|nr:unnamed protein product [Blepharisma stoltei]
MERQGDYVYIEDGAYTSANLLCIPEKYKAYIDLVFISKGQIEDRILRLAETLTSESKTRSIALIVILRGAFRFAKDLVDGIDRACYKEQFVYTIDFIRARSYVGQTQHDIILEGLDALDLEGKEVVIVEDLVDSGNTLSRVASIIREKNPASLKICVLIYKRNPENTRIVPDHIGFSVPNEWIIGYHTDYNNYFRDLPHICLLNDAGKEEFRTK